MVVDSSAILAIFYDEPDAKHFEFKLNEASNLSMSAATFAEASVAVLRRRGHQAVPELAHFVASMQIEVVDFNATQSTLAIDAYSRYGKGLHPAGLNLGDCFSYALSRYLGRPLLFKGNDFSKTDVTVA